jgi:endoglycosylceramidase
MNLGVEIWKNDARPWKPDAYENGQCPTAETSVNQPPVCGVEAGKGKWNQSTTFDSRNDLAQMRALGFNLIRLAMSWSLLEPEPLKYSSEYLDRIAQVVHWAAEQDIMVILDMHQDEYSPDVGGSDGAPAWACLNVSYPAWLEAAWPLIADKLPYSKRVLSAFDAFYMNHPVEATGRGLQEHFLLAWAEVLKRFDNTNNVIGYEILNEPPPGIATIVNSVSKIPVLGFSAEYLYPLYRRFIQMSTGVRDGMSDCPNNQPVGECAFPDLNIHTEKLILFEPMALRNQLDVSLQVSKPFTEYRNIVFAPHCYTHFFTAQNWPPSYKLSLDSAWFEANLMRASVLVTEFGGSALSPDKVGNITAQLDVHSTSGTMWTWKEHRSWGMFEPAADPKDPNGPLYDVRVKINSRVYARAVAGTILEHHFDHLSGSFRVRVSAGPGWRQSTEIYIPAHVAGEPKVSGAAALRGVSTQPDGSRIVEVHPWVTGGIYTLQLGDPSAPAASHPNYTAVSSQTLERLGQAIYPILQVPNSPSALSDVLEHFGAELYQPQAAGSILV